MKKILILTALALFSGHSYAQMQASGGLELGVPFKDYASFMAGASGGFEYVVVDKLAVTGQLGFAIVFTNDNVNNSVYYNKNIPMVFFQVGGKYYFQEIQKGFYGHVQMGLHNRSMKYVYGENTSVETSYRVSRTGFSIAAGGGYQLDNFDIGLRFNAVTGGTYAYYSGYSSGTGMTYLGLRVAYLIPIGD